MHPYFSTTVLPWQTVNPIDPALYQRQTPWFDPNIAGFQSMYNPALQNPVIHNPGLLNPVWYNAPIHNPAMYNPPIYRSVFPDLETMPYVPGNAYYSGILPRPVFHVPPASFTPESAHGVPGLGVPGFGISDYLSPANFVSSFAKAPGNYLPPEFLEFLRAELLRCGKALRTVAPALEHDNNDVKEQAHLAATAQFFYALGLLYTRGLIIPPDVPGTSRVEEQSASTACEVFGEALERFAREQFLTRGNGRELGELSEKARICFRALAPDSEQLERLRDEGIRMGRKKAVSA
jgi:hypothetical protein